MVSSLLLGILLAIGISMVAGLYGYFQGTKTASQVVKSIAMPGLVASIAGSVFMYTGSTSLYQICFGSAITFMGIKFLISYMGVGK